MSATVQTISAETAGVAAASWDEVKARAPGAVGNAAEAAILVPVFVLAAHFGVPWEAIALLVPRLQHHAKKVKTMISAAKKKIEHADD